MAIPGGGGAAPRPHTEPAGFSHRLRGTATNKKARDRTKAGKGLAYAVGYTPTSVTLTVKS